MLNVIIQVKVCTFYKSIPGEFMNNKIRFIIQYPQNSDHLGNFKYQDLQFTLRDFAPVGLFKYWSVQRINTRPMCLFDGGVR